MANRDFKFTQAIEREVKFLAFEISDIPLLGAGGACTVTPSLGIASVVANAGGDPVITVTLEDKYNALLSATANTSVGANCQFVNFLEETVAVDGVFYFKLSSFSELDGGAAVVPIDADKLQVFVALKNTSVAR